MRESKHFSLPQARRELAKISNQQVWELLEKPDRTPAEEEHMLLAAYASLYLWKKGGTPAHHQRGCWLISKVHCSLEQPGKALEWALKCQQITEKFSLEMADFDLAYTQEILARAYALSGDLELAKKHRGEAVRLGKLIEDTENRDIFESDLQAGNWFQLTEDQS